MLNLNKNYILDSKIFHKRYKPEANSFTYSLYYLMIDPFKPQSFTSKLLSQNKFGLHSYCFKDHGKKLVDENPTDWLNGILKKYDAYDRVKKVRLITLPRVLFYIFNPVSFWLCFDDEDRLIAVLTEVNNTFSETHSYFLAHQDFSEIDGADVFNTQKLFHVSPFFDREGGYEFKFDLLEDKIAIYIDYYKDDELKLKTSVVSKLEDLNDAGLFKHFLKIPFITLKTIVLIHWQALKLCYKKAKFHKKPEQKETRLSRNE